MRRTSYALIIGRIADVRLFAVNIGFSIHRKGRKLLDAIEIIDTIASIGRSRAWARLYTKIEGKWVRRESH